MVKPNFTTDVLEAVVREGADELTLRAEEGTLRTIIDTADVGDNRWGLPLVDEDAICQAIVQGV